MKMKLPFGGIPKHAVRGRSGPMTLRGAVAASVVVGAAMVLAPVVNVLTAGPAAAAAVISQVGTPSTVDGTGLATAADNPQHVGDVLVVTAEEDNTAAQVSAVSGGGVTTWHQAIHYVGSASAENRDYDMWYGVVTATGSSTITFTWSASIASNTAEYEVAEFSATFGTNTVWTLDKTGHQDNTTNSTTVTYASLTPGNADELYFGFADMPNAPSAGSTTGFSYMQTADANQIAWNPDVTSAGVAVQPTSTQGASDVSSSVALLMGATSSIAPTVTAVSPSSGPPAGGTSVTVTGTNLTGATAVDFGLNAGTNVSVNGGGTSLTVTSPAGSAGTVDITVTTPDGTSAASAADRFTYQNAGSYWMVGNDGGVFAFGGAPFEGSLPGLGVHVKNIVSIVPTSDGKGYWMIGSDGGVFAFGDAGFVGSLPGLGVHINDVVGAVPTSSGKGYWMVGKDGGVFAFGDAGFVGSIPGLGVHVGNIVAVVPTSDGKGYWMIGSDGGVFAFGDAGFVGSLPGLNVHVNNVVGAVPTSSGKGYWMVGTDGGVFAFGDAGFLGSLPGLGVHVKNVVGVVATADNKGYWMVGTDGGVFAFGDAGFVGSLPGLGVHVSNIVGFAPHSS